MSSQYLGEIRLVAFTRLPSNWHVCDGSVLPIDGNVALYTLLGTTYGGDGTSTFGLPNLQGAVPIHVGAQQGFSFALGQTGGSAGWALLSAQMAPHSHPVTAVVTPGTAAAANANWLAGITDGYAPATAATATTLRPGTVQSAGAGSAHENRQPYLCLNYIIALAGIYPPNNQ